VSAPHLQAEISLNRRSVARLRSEIARIDPSARRAYVRTFHQEFQRLVEPSTFDDLVIACFQADLIYVGDFHALPRSQEFAARLLQEIARRSRRSVLAMEMVYGRHQQVLDRWMAGEVDDPEFLRRIRYDQEWGYDWAAFRGIFETARRHGLRVQGIDCAPRNGLRFIRERDRYMAARIADIFAEAPGSKVVVVVGESHLASSHLPAAVRQALARMNLERRSVRVLQNLEEVYWQLLSQGREHADTALVGRNVFCVFNVSPLEKYEAYRQTLERWNQERPDDAELDLTPTIHNMIDTILKFLGVNKYRRAAAGRDGAGPGFVVDAYPEVYSRVETLSLERLLRSQKVPRADIAEIVEHLKRRGSCYIPSVNAIFIGTFSLVHGGEEAAHFVNHLLRGGVGRAPQGTRSRAGAFYGAVIDEALGFFGSKIIDPSRNHFFETKFYRYYRKSREIVERETGFSYEEFCEIINFILLHKKFERHYRDYDHIPGELLEGIRTKNRRRFSLLTHELGYFLGQQLYDGFHAGVVSREEVDGLFRRTLDGRNEALELYLDLSERLPGGVAPPLKS